MKTSIPQDVKDVLAKEPRMKQCALRDEMCVGRIEWHHALMSAGKAVQEPWAILGLCQHHHYVADRKDMRAKIVAEMRRLGGADVHQFEKIKRL